MLAATPPTLSILGGLLAAVSLGVAGGLLSWLTDRQRPLRLARRAVAGAAGGFLAGFLGPALGLPLSTTALQGVISSLCGGLALAAMLR